MKDDSRKFSWSSVASLLRLVWQAHPTACLGTALATVIQGLLPLGTAWVAKVLIDTIVANMSGSGVTMSSIVILLGLQAVFGLGLAVLPAVTQFLSSDLQRRLTVLIESRIYTKTNSLPGIRHFENPAAYDTIRLAQQGSRSGATMTLSTLTRLGQGLVTLLSFVGVLFAFNLLLAVLVVAVAIPQLFVELKIGRQRYKLMSEVSGDERKKFYLGHLLVGTSAAKEVRLFNLGEFLLDKLLALYRRVHGVERSQELRELRWGSWLKVLSAAVGAGAFALVIFAAFDGRITVGDVSLFMAAIVSVQSSLASSVLSLTTLREILLFYSYLEKLFEIKPSIRLAEESHPVLPLRCEIEFRDVSFRYNEGHPWILRNVSLTIREGECLALVGLNGAGKTTLVKLLTRLYDPDEGQILWDGTDIRDFDPEDFRRRIGAVLQDFARYEFSVRENIGMGDLEHLDDHARIERSARQAGIHDAVTKLPQGYETEISRMFGPDGSGIDLSGGQWQKLAIARMLSRRADLMILDEPTAALDAEAERDLYERFSELMTDRTSLLISHRFSTIKMADRIVVLDGGAISESGTHAELMAQGGRYAELYQFQADRYKDEPPGPQVAPGHPVPSGSPVSVQMVSGPPSFMQTEVRP